MREDIYHLIRKANKHEKWSKLYNFFICGVAILSIVPLMFKKSNAILDMLDLVTVYLLFMDYIFRWIVADYMMKKPKGVWAFIVYPLTPYALLVSHHHILQQLLIR